MITPFVLNEGEPEAGFEWSDLLDSGQFNNVLYGLLRAKGGLEQAFAEIGETIGVLPAGEAEYVNYQLEKEHEAYRQDNIDDMNLDGATGFQLAGELLPTLFVPLGGTLRSASAIGAAVGGTMYQDNPQDQSRLLQAATGAALGAGVRKGIDFFRNKNMAQKVTQVPQEVVPPAPVGRIATPPAPVPQARLAANAPPVTKAAPVNPAELNTPFSQRSVTPVEKAIEKLGYPTGAKAVAAASKKLDVGLKKLLKKEQAIIKSLKTATGDRAVKLNKMLLKTGEQITAARAGAQILAGTESKIPNALSRKEAVAIIKDEYPQMTNKDIARLPKKALVDKANAIQQVNKDFVESSKAFNDDMTTATQRVTEEAQARMSGNAGSDIPMPTNDTRVPTNGLPMAADVPVGPPRPSPMPANMAQGAAEEFPIPAGPPRPTSMPSNMAREGGEELVDTTPFGSAPKKDRNTIDTIANRSESYADEVDDVVKSGEIEPSRLASIWSEGLAITDQYLGSIMTRLEKLAPSVAGALARQDFRQSQKSGQILKAGEVFFRELGKASLTGEQRTKLKIHMLTDTRKAEKYLRSIGATPELRAGLLQLQDNMVSNLQYLEDVKLAGFSQMSKKQLAAALRKASPTSKNIDALTPDELLTRLKSLSDEALDAARQVGYYPRQIANMAKFSQTKEAEALFKLLRVRKGKPLSDADKQEAIEKVISGALSNTGKDVAFAKASSNLKRRVQDVTKDNVDDYMDMESALAYYAESITKQAERRRFLHGQGVHVDDLGVDAESGTTIARRMTEALTKAKPDMTVEEVTEAADLISLRFSTGEQASGRGLQNFRNLTLTGLLANPLSAMTQAGDLAIGGYKNGIRNTASEIVKSLVGMNSRSGLDVSDLMGINNIAADFASSTGTREVLNWSLKYSGFRNMDRFGKNVFIRAALKNNQQLDDAAFKAKWSKNFDFDSVDGSTPRTDALLQKVRNFKKIDDTNRDDIGLMLWNELSGAQPISLSSFPEKYLANPNGRVLYMLQSFTLKTFDIMRKDIADAARAGDTKRAVANATKFASLFVLGNGTIDGAKDFILGRDVAPQDLMVNNMLKIFGINKYTVESASRLGLGGAILNTIAPPTAIVDALGDPRKALSMVPIVGKLAAEYTKQ